MQAVISRLKGSRLWGRPEDARSWWQVIIWWEVRRVAYNLIVGLGGIITCAALFGIAMYAERTIGSPVGLPDPPVVGLFAIVAYGIGANVCYTSGWIGELLARSVWPGKMKDFGVFTFAAGTMFSAVLTLAPIVLFGGVVIFMQATGYRV